MSDTPGSELGLKRDHMKWVWMAAFAVVAVFGAGATPWDAIRDLLENKGVSEEGSSLLAFVAGYTFPLTLGCFALVLMYLRGIFSTWYWVSTVATVTAVLALAGSLASSWGLGLLPDYSVGPPEGGHPVVRAFAWVLSAYFNTYGWGLMICALTVGTALAVQLHVWVWPAEET